VMTHTKVQQLSQLKCHGNKSYSLTAMLSVDECSTQGSLSLRAQTDAVCHMVVPRNRIAMISNRQSASRPLARHHDVLAKHMRNMPREMTAFLV